MFLLPKKQPSIVFLWCLYPGTHSASIRSMYVPLEENRFTGSDVTELVFDSSAFCHYIVTLISSRKPDVGDELLFGKWVSEQRSFVVTSEAWTRHH